jgi:kynurenine formamidase
MLMRTSCVWILATGVWVGAAAVGAAGPQSNKANPFNGCDIKDLTHVLREGIPVYPGGESFTITKLADLSQGYYLNKFSTGEHCGTHVDAPIHFIAGGNSIDEIAPPRLVGPLVLLDVRQAAAANPDLEITLDDVRQWEKAHNEIPMGAFVVAHTGWWKKWSTPKDYVNVEQDGRAHFPGFSSDAARFLVEMRKIRGVGIDTLSIDPGVSKEFPAHHIVLKTGAINIENMTNLDDLPKAGATLVIAPLRIGKGSGAPARVFAVVPRSERN